MTAVAHRRFPVEVRNGPLTEDEAKEITLRIRQQVSDLWQLVTEAHDRKAWKALGYPSWRRYVELELRMSESRSYQLIDAGHVIRVAEQIIGNVSNTLEFAPTAREAAKAKNNLPALRRTLRAQVKAGLPPQEALREAIKALPDKKVPAQRQSPEVKATPAKTPPTKRIPKGTKCCPRCGGLGYV